VRAEGGRRGGRSGRGGRAPEQLAAGRPGAAHAAGWQTVMRSLIVIYMRQFVPCHIAALHSPMKIQNVAIL
jgi:hypothetical protein